MAGGEHKFLHTESWYAYEFETAGERENPKVIVHEVMFRTRTIAPEESVHLLIEGPPVTKLFKFMLSNLAVLRLPKFRLRNPKA